MEVLEEDNPNDVQISKFVRRVPNDKRKIIFEALLNYNVERKVRHGAIRDVASIYSVSTRTVSRIWKKGIDCVKHGVPVDTSLNLTGNVGRKKDLD
nr:Transposase, Tc1-like protein [Ipomoea batatas]